MDEFLVHYPNNVGGKAAVMVQVTFNGNTFAVAVTQSTEHRGLSITTGFETVLPHVIIQCLKLAEAEPASYPMATRMAEAWKATLPSLRPSILDRLLRRPLPDTPINFHTTAAFCRDHIHWYEIYEKPEAIRYQRLMLDAECRPFWIPIDSDVIAQEGLAIAA